MHLLNLRGAAPEIRELVRTADEQGWEISRCGNGKLKFQPPSGPPVFTGYTGAGPRGWANAKALLRRHGLKT